MAWLTCISDLSVAEVQLVEALVELQTHAQSMEALILHSQWASNCHFTKQLLVRSLFAVPLQSDIRKQQQS